MFKSIALKMSAAVLGILSISFSGIINDALRVDAAADDYTDYPLSIGLFDTVDLVNGTVTHQTGYCKLGDLSNWRIQSLANSRRGFRADLPDLAIQSSTSSVGFLACQDYSTLSAGAVYNGSVGVSEWSTTASIVFYDSSKESMSASDFYNSVKDLKLQYKMATPLGVVSLDDVLDYPNLNEAYSDGYATGRDAAIDVEQSVTVRVGSNSYGFHVKVTLGDGSVIEQDLNAYAPYVSFRRSPQSVAKIELSDSYSDEQPYFNVSFVSGVTTYSGIYNSLVVNGAVYLPTWENPVDVVVRTTGAPDFSDVNDLRFDPANFNNVFVGSGPYSEGYEAGKSYGEDQGYSSGHSAGYSDGYAVGYGEGQAAGASGGWLEGYSAGVAQGGGNVEMIDVWPLMGAVVTMPFTFFSQGLDWTLFKGSPYEFGVSIFFGSVLVILMLWKIIQLVIGLGK